MDGEMSNSATSPEPNHNMRLLPVVQSQDHQVDHSDAGSSVQDQQGTKGEVPTLEFMELELALDGFADGQSGFAEAVKSSVQAMDGEFLFDLPASGISDDCQRIAAIRVPHGDELTLAFVHLSLDGQTLDVREPDADTADLASFATAFVEVLERL